MPEPELALVPERYALHPNHPNPFNPETTIGFDLPEKSRVLLLIYNLKGQEVTCLIDREMEAGCHRIPFNTNALPSGVYLYRLTAGEFTQIRRMLLLK